MLKKENLKSYIDELIKEVEEELTEETSTGAVDGYQTPFAFSGKRKSDKEKEASNIKVTGYTKVKDIDESTTPSDIIKDLDKAKNDLLKKVDVLVAKKKKLYSNVDIESPMSAEEKKLDKDIADLFSQINSLVLQKRKIKESVNESWEAKDGKVLSNGKLIGYYEFDRGSDSFWVDPVHKKNVKAGVGQIGFDTKNDVINYFKKNEKEAIKHLGKLRESVFEGKSKRPVNRWLELKNDDSMHANKKLAVGLRELKHQLSEVEKFFRWYNQIKTMNELSSDSFWKRTNTHIYRIKERLINIAKTIQEIEK